MRRRDHRSFTGFFRRGRGFAVRPRYRSFVTGFIGGAVVGATSALFVAPRAGQAAREQVHQRTRALQSRAHVLVERVGARSRDALACGRVLVEAVAETAREQVQEIGQHLRMRQAPASGAPDAARNGPLSDRPSMPAPGN